MNLPATIKAVALAAALGLPAARSAPAAADEPPAAKVPESTLPDGIRGFRGMVAGRLVDKDVEQGRLVLNVEKIERVWKNNTAKDPQSLVGKTVTIDGVRGRFLDNLLAIKPEDRLEIEVYHSRGEHLSFLGEVLKKLDEPKADGSKPSASTGVPEGLRGFRGMLVGELLNKDDEAGTLVFRAERVSKVWKGNKAENPQAAVGMTLRVDGIRGKFLDTLLTLKPGDKVEVEAFHNRGEKLDFPGEWLKKVEK
jgi:hypothetical protein